MDNPLLFATAVAICMAIVVVMYSAILAYLPQLSLQDRRTRKASVKLEQFGYQLVTYTRNNVTAACTYRTFNGNLENWKNKVSKNPEAEWSTQIIHVKPTFTFAAERMPLVTGNCKDLEDITADLIYDLLERKYDKSFIRENIKDLGKIIVKRDSRLFVPFAGDKWQPEWEQYRYTDIQLAHLCLHKDVISALPRNT